MGCNRLIVWNWRCQIPME